MKVKNVFLLLTALFLAGCYGTLRGKVIDAETGAPIEGAVALAEWTKTKGFGNTYTVSVKVVEAVSGKDGNIELEGCCIPFVNKPSLTIYKKGYMAWNNKYIFPGWVKRKNFEWEKLQNFKMEKFNPKFSYDSHVSFVNSTINSNFGNKLNFMSLYEWEEEYAYKERRKK